MATPRQPITCPGHSRPVVALEFRNVDGLSAPLVVSACHDKLAMLRWADTGDWIGTFKGHKGAIWGCDLNPTGELAATASADFSVGVWSAATGIRVSTYGADEFKHIVKDVKFSSSSNKLATACMDKKIRVFDAATADAVSIEACGAAGVKCAWLDEFVFVSAHQDNAVRWWDLRVKGETKRAELDSAGASRKGVTDVSLCGEMVIASCGKSVNFLSSNGTTQRAPFISEIEVKCCSSNTSVFAFGGSDLDVHGFDLNDDNRVFRLKGHHGPVFACRFNGDVLGTGSEDGTVRLWPV